MSEQPFHPTRPSSKQTYSPPINEVKTATLPPVNHLPLRKRLALDSTIKTPKKQFVKQLQLEQQLLRQEQISTTTVISTSPKIESTEYPLTPGSHSSSHSSDSTATLAHSPPQNTELMSPVVIKKQPLKKVYNWFSTSIEAKSKKTTNVLVDHSKQGLVPIHSSKLPGNPLLWNNGKVETYAPEDTIDSFKSAWLEGDDDEDLDDQDNDIVQEKKKPPSQLMAQARKPPSYNSKRKRPSISKSTIDRDSPKPTRKNSSGNGRTNRSTSDGKLYCICRQPYDATRFMIACDRCDDWFHGECIHINEKESEFVDLYFCSKCAKLTGKKTLWKPKCANPACHKAARIGSHIGHLSKYCSDACGMQVARARLELVEIKRRNCMPSPQVRIAQLALKKQKQLRANSLADRQDRDRLEQINQEKIVIRDNVLAIDRKCKLLNSLNQQTDEICGFDERLIWSDLIWMQKIQPPNDYSVCQHSIDCIVHSQWQDLFGLELDQERKEQYHILIKLERERDQIKSRMRKRRSELDMIKDLINSTL